jgi:3-hydroxybutyryl-CoA dehydrogenase
MFEIQTVGIVGAGLMGTGIAEVCALAGLRTILIRATAGDPSAALERVRKSMQTRVSKGKLTSADADAALARLEATGELAAASACDLVIESIVEDEAAKRDLFARLTPHLRSQAILASNTSTLKISALAAGHRETRMLGLHFFSPVPAMSLVEIAHLPQTDPDAFEAAQAFVTRLGKTSVPVLDSTGFIVNRLLVPVLTGAIAAYEAGLASAEHIDAAMKLGCGHPMGPLALADLIGLDVVYAMAKLLYKEFGDDRFRPPALLRRLVQGGHLGKKTGLGLYDYRHKPARGNTEALLVVHGDDADVDVAA